MAYLALGCILLGLLVWLGRGRPVLKRREWRLLSGMTSLAAFSAAAFVGLRGGWGTAIVLVVVGLWLLTSTRAAGGATPPQDREPMSETEARSILGVGPDAGRADVQAAYARLMRMAHPDKGGTDGLAAQLNAARDRLLKG